MAGFFSAQRRAWELLLARSWRRPFWGPLAWGLDRALAPRVASHLRGEVLDAGCGMMPYRALITKGGARYHGFDLSARVEGVEVIGDLQDAPGLKDGAFDAALCSEVLEHLPAPERGLATLARVLCRGGVLVLSMPFLARLHEEPHDHTRWTEHALRHRLAEAGFEVRELVRTGGLATFLGHQVASALLLPVAGIPALRDLALIAVAVVTIIPARIIDLLPGMRLFPSGYVVVAVKR